MVQCEFKARPQGSYSRWERLRAFGWWLSVWAGLRGQYINEAICASSRSTFPQIQIVPGPHTNSLYSLAASWWFFYGKHHQCPVMKAALRFPEDVNQAALFQHTNQQVDFCPSVARDLAQVVHIVSGAWDMLGVLMSHTYTHLCTPVYI